MASFVAFETLKSLSLAEVITLIGASIALYAAMREETRDFLKIEVAAGKVKDQVSLKALLEQTERVRRVSWRMGVCTAAMATLTLMLLGSVQRQHALLTALVCWVWVTAALNFRAFHVEDPAWRIQRERIA